MEFRLIQTPRVMFVRGGEGKCVGVGEWMFSRVGFELGERMREKENERVVRERKIIVAKFRCNYIVRER